MRRALTMTLSLSLAGCGARSDLSAAGGAGGAAPASSASASSASGGAPAVWCRELELDGPPIQDVHELYPYGSEGDPTLVAVDDTRVMLFHTTFNDIAQNSLVASTFEPWGAWPDSLDYHHYLAVETNGITLATRGLGTGDATALLTLAPYDPPGQTTFLAPSIPHSTHYPDNDVPGVPLAAVNGHATSLAAAGNLIFASYRRDDQLVQLMTDELGVLVAGPVESSGCADAYGPGAALAVGNAFFSVFASGRAWGVCLNNDDPVGPPERVQIERWDTEGTITRHFVAERFAGEPLAVIALAPRPGGAWLVTQTDGSTSRTYPAVIGTPLDEKGDIAGPDVVLLPDGMTDGHVAIAALGSLLGLAWAPRRQSRSACASSAPTARSRPKRRWTR